MPYKDKQELREYNREWARRKRAGLDTKIINPRKPTPDEIHKRRYEYQKEYRKRKIAEAINIVGDKCFICGKQRRLIFHKKDGELHDTSCTEMLVLKNPNEWVRLCEWCHKAVHWNMKMFNMTWVEIIERLKYLNKI